MIIKYSNIHPNTDQGVGVVKKLVGEDLNDF